MRVGEIWRRVTATRYTRALEREVARLRAENRALLNSILGIAGVPPITAEPAPLDGFAAPVVGLHTETECAFEAGGSGKRESSSLRSLGMRATGKETGQAEATRTSRMSRGTGGRVHVAAPLRKRSWQQINRALEFASARKEKPGSMTEADAPGIPRTAGDARNRNG